MIGLHLIHSHNSELHTIQSYRYSTHFQFTVTHAQVFSVFTSRILATDLLQPHCHFSSHLTSCSHSLIPFFPFHLSHLILPSLELDPFLDKSPKRQSQVKVTLRLTVSQSLNLGVKYNLGHMTRYLVLFDSYGLVFFLWGALSDERAGLSFVSIALCCRTFQYNCFAHTTQKISLYC
jgi:hypothetical protein